MENTYFAIQERNFYPPVRTNFSGMIKRANILLLKSRGVISGIDK
jgi:hypothetical protein